ISVIFSVKNQVGGLVRVLGVFQDLGINVLHIESRKSAMELSAACRQHTHDGERISVIFSVKNQVGGLVRVLGVFQDLGINVLHIESRKSAMELSA
ncbi:jg15409, partial [Pararge aegeria aegeria]